MSPIQIDFPTDCASAIRTVLYLRGWRTYKPLAEAMGLADTTMLSRLVRYKVAGTDAMRDRVLEHMPESAKTKDVELTDVQRLGILLGTAVAEMRVEP